MSEWRRGPLIGWALYDFANTVFSLSVITRYFNEWYIDQQNRNDIEVGLMSLVVGLTLVFAMPAAGAISDQLGRRLPFLALYTGLCVSATILLGLVSSPLLALVLAGFAIFSYQLALSMYDPLLAVVAKPGHEGAASGFGVGLGYVGVLFANFALAWWVAGPGGDDFQSAFIPTALAFAFFAIPIFVLVREPKVERPVTHRASVVVRRAIGQVNGTIRHIRSDHGMTGRFLIARFFYVDAIATVIAYMTVYTKRLDAFSEQQVTILLGLSMISAAVGAFVAGRLVEAIGPKRVLQGILGIATATLAAAGITGSATLVWALGPLVGVTLGAVWTSDRVVMLRLTPPPLRGEFFAVYNLVGKLSSGFGPFVLWGGTIWLLHTQADIATKLGASRAALVVLAGAVVCGMLILRGVRVPGQTSEPEGTHPAH